MLKHLYLLFFVLGLGSLAEAQIRRPGSQVVDDTTRNVYGPKTTRWITESDLFFNRNNYQVIDTTINNYHRWSYVSRFNNKYKDLGNVGTALHPIFPEISSTIGVKTGFGAYDLFYDSEDPRYFDTKSPYTRIRIIWGGDGRAMTQVEFSRNISPRWNFGFNYRPILVDKQIQRRGKGDRQTISTYYDVYTAYKSKNERYEFIFNYRRIRHRVNENGGIIVVSDIPDPFDALFDKNNRPRLTAANSVELQNKIHLFNRYKIGEALRIYHKLDGGREINLYNDNIAVEPQDFYDNRINVDTLNPDLARDSTHFSYWTNEVGLTGKVGKLFYNGFVKTRSYKMGYKYLTADTLALPFSGVEVYLGGQISYAYDSITRLTGHAEFLADGNYLVEGELNTRWLDGKAIRTLSKPSFLQNAYRGSFDFWNNDFNDVTSTQIKAFGKARVGTLFVKAGFTYTSLQDYIYFRRGVFPGTSQTVLPLQSGGKQELVSPEISLDYTFFRYFHFRPQVIYTRFLSNDDEALRVPEVFMNIQLAIERTILKDQLQVQAGLDFHRKSSYFDLGYDPSVQQFFVQDETVTPSFLLADIFFNAKMKRGRFFFKYNNLVQAFTQSGFLATPVFPGQRNILDFGFEILLFD